MLERRAAQRTEIAQAANDHEARVQNGELRLSSRRSRRRRPRSRPARELRHERMAEREQQIAELEARLEESSARRSKRREQRRGAVGTAALVEESGGPFEGYTQ